jgi:hypothetical protein
VTLFVVSIEQTKHQNKLDAGHGSHNIAASGALACSDW